MEDRMKKGVLVTGADALLDPDESADDIFQLAAREWKTDDPIYVDFRGNPLPW
jgi:hypothetical protein